MRSINLRLSRTDLLLVAALIFIAAIFAATFVPSKVVLIEDGRKVEIKTRKILVRDVLKENQISVSSFDKVYPSLDSCVSDSSNRIIIKKARRVLISKRGFKESHITFARNFKELYQELGLKDRKSIFVRPSGNLDSQTILIIEKARQVEINYLVYFDERGRVVSAKKNAGVKKVKMRKLYSGDTLVASLILEEKVLKQPVKIMPKKVVARSMVRGRKITSRGDSRQVKLSDSKVFEMVSTAYAPGAGAGYITATGARAGYGIAAVDPSVIPLGTKLYIPGYGYAVALDTGGAIKGMRIDLCFDSRIEALNWGRRRVTVYIVEK
ncbi:MAG: 3D domain-containing protein [Actinobacteria bacterium]|nr:3D domain-containing protein [Actinomycetota bacterium]